MSSLASGVASSVEGVSKGVSQTPENVFAKELHYQVYRIENVLKITDPNTVSQFVTKYPEYSNRPLLQSFFESYRNRNVNEFIKTASGKTQGEREKLLEGIRKLIYKAKQERQVVQKEAKEPSKEKDSQIAHLEGLLTKKKYEEQDFYQIEKNVSTPFNIGKGKLNFNKIRYFYTSILTGQKAFGLHVQSMQTQYKTAIDQLKSYQAQYNSGWKHHVGIADYGIRKIKSLFRWGKKKLGYKVDKTKKEKINASITKARAYYAERLNRVKLLKTHIANRSVELKKGLGVFRGDLREKLKVMISRGEWTEDQKKKSEKAKEILEQKKKQLSNGLVSAKKHREEIESAQQGTSRMQQGLQNKLKKVRLSEPLMQKKVESVKKRIAQLEKVYGKQDPRVIELRTKVLVPLMKGQDRIIQVREGTAAKLTEAEKRYQGMNILKANVSLNETDIINQIEVAELNLSHTTKRIEQLKKNRIELQKVLEGMETAYIAVDEFKVNISKNLDKMSDVNTKTVKGLDGQYKYLEQAKATDPGIGSSLYNTIIIGKWGSMGVLKYGINYIPRYMAYVFNGGNWEASSKWSITGMLGQVQQGFDKWLKKDGFRQYGRKNMFWQWFASNLNIGAGILNTAVGLVDGVANLVFNPDKVLDSLGMMLTDWKATKEMLKGVIHYDDWANGRADIAFGKTAGDLIVLFLTAGASAGAGAAATATAKLGVSAGRFARMSAYAFAYVKGFMKEVARKSWNIPKNIGRFAWHLPSKTWHGIDYLVKSEYALRKGWMKGLRSFIYDRGLTNAKAIQLEDAGKYLRKLPKRKLGRLNASTRKMLQDVLGNPDSAKIKLLMERLESEFYAGGWRTRQILGPLQSKLRRYIKLDIKHMKGKEFLRRKYGSLEVAKGVSKDAIQSSDVMTKYVAAQEELEQAKAIIIPKKAKGVTDKMINKAKNERARAIEKAEKNLKEQGQLLEKRYKTMRVKNGVLEESISPEEAMFRYKKAKAEFAEAEKMKVPRKGKIKEASIREAQARLVEEKELLENVKGNSQEVLMAADDLLTTLEKTSPQTFFAKIRAKSQVRDLIRRLKLEDEFGIKVGDRVIRLQGALNEIKIFERAVLKTKKVLEIIRTNGITKSTKILFKDVIALPIWLKLKSIPSGLKITTKEIRNWVLNGGRNGKMFEKVAKMSAVKEVSAEINLLLKKGHLIKALKLYKLARRSARSVGIPFAVMDKSFLGYLHRVAPITVLYLKRADDLVSQEKIAKLPVDAKVDISQFETLQKEQINIIKKYKI